MLSIPDYAYAPFGQQQANPQAISAGLDAYNAINQRVSKDYGVYSSSSSR